jgi:hypothetical protein
VISAGEGFQIRHRSGRYYRSELIHFGDRVSYAPGSYGAVYALESNPFAATLIYSAEHWQRHLDGPEWANVADQFEIVPGPGCACCGERWGTMWGEVGQYRCDKHKDRNPCAIEGCRCTNDRRGRAMRSDQFLCQKHWRPLTTAEERRVYSRIWRQAKARERKFGAEHAWSMREVRRLERVWRAIVAKARSRAAGDLDMTEINKMFGWDA